VGPKSTKRKRATQTRGQKCVLKKSGLRGGKEPGGVKNKKKIWTCEELRAKSSEARQISRSRDLGKNQKKAVHKTQVENWGGGGADGTTRDRTYLVNKKKREKYGVAKSRYHNFVSELKKAESTKGQKAKPKKLLAELVGTIIKGADKRWLLGGRPCVGASDSKKEERLFKRSEKWERALRVDL